MFSSVQNLSSSATSNDQWKRVILYKKDGIGGFKLNGEGKRKEYTYLMHIPSGDLYLDEEKEITSGKSGAVFLATPFYTAASMLWYLGRVVYDTLAIGLAAIKQFGESIYAQGALIRPALDAVSSFASGLWTQVVSKDLWKVVRLPIYAVGMELAALYGIFSPFDGRRIEAMIEHSLQDYAFYKQDYRQKVPERSSGCLNDLKATAQGISNADAFYLAYCFQVRGNYNEPRFTLGRELE